MQVVDSIPFEVSQESHEKSTNGGENDSSVNRRTSSVLSVEESAIALAKKKRKNQMKRDKLKMKKKAQKMA